MYDIIENFKFMVCIVFHLLWSITSPSCTKTKHLPQTINQTYERAKNTQSINSLLQIIQEILADKHSAHDKYLSICALFELKKQPILLHEIIIAYGKQQQYLSKNINFIDILDQLLFILPAEQQNASNDLGETPLHLVTKLGNSGAAIAELLLKHGLLIQGFNIIRLDKTGQSPIDIAVRNHAYQVLEILVHFELPLSIQINAIQEPYRKEIFQEEWLPKEIPSNAIPLEPFQLINELPCYIAFRIFKLDYLIAFNPLWRGYYYWLVEILRKDSTRLANEVMHKLPQNTSNTPLPFLILSHDEFYHAFLRSCDQPNQLSILFANNIVATEYALCHIHAEFMDSLHEPWHFHDLANKRSIYLAMIIDWMSTSSFAAAIFMALKQKGYFPYVQIPTVFLIERLSKYHQAPRTDNTDELSVYLSYALELGIDKINHTIFIARFYGINLQPIFYPNNANSVLSTNKMTL